jgi:hypothetical protein
VQNRIYANDLLSASSSAWKDSRGGTDVDRSSGRDRRDKDRDHAPDSRHDGKKLYFEKPVEEVSYYRFSENKVPFVSHAPLHLNKSSNAVACSSSWQTGANLSNFVDVL